MVVIRTRKDPWVLGNTDNVCDMPRTLFRVGRSRLVIAFGTATFELIDSVLELFGDGIL